MSQDLPNFPVKRKREPKVIVFEEPRRRNQKGGPGAKKKLKTLDQRREQQEAGATAENDVDFVDMAREVKEFGMTGFSRKEQRKNKQRYAEYLGAHKKKAEKVPYPLLMERIKQRKTKEERQRQLDEAMGVFKKKKKEDKANLTLKHNLGHWVDKSKVDGLRSAGKKNASLRRVNKHEVRKIQSMKI